MEQCLITVAKLCQLKHYGRVSLNERNLAIVNRELKRP
jgi:hypothetical protein